jgi:hypothetical protein
VLLNQTLPQTSLFPDGWLFFHDPILPCGLVPYKRKILFNVIIGLLTAERDLCL